MIRGASWRAIGRLAGMAAAICGCSSTQAAPAPMDAGDEASADGGPVASWQAVLEHLDGALLSVWGSGPSDVYAVGGPRGNSGFTTLVLHFDGATWRRLAPGGTETYWWAHGSGAGDVWMVGEKGRITHWDGAKFVESASGTTATIFGVWAATPTDAWAVGGTPEGGTAAPNDIVLHWDGSAWTPSPLPGAPLGRTLFKVWGTASDNLYAVGEYGTIWHRKGTSWALESNPPLAHGTLLTVSGCNAGEVYAVGSRDVLRSDGTSWTAVTVDLPNDVNGVACNAPGEVAIVGFGGLKERLVGGAWKNEFNVPPFADFHGAWSDKAGAFWAVGGDFISGPAAGVSRQGVVARYGIGSVASSVSP